MGIKEITVYAFSIENFKRPKEEVNGLFDLVRKKLTVIKKYLDENRDDCEKELKDRRIGVRVIGDITLFPDDLKRTLAEICLNETDDHDFYLNIGVGYTSRAELAASMDDLVWGSKEGLLKER
jgi:ditrans,polycis-polyprenyl diphosphate synthase